jgi:hypothetical protein
LQGSFADNPSIPREEDAMLAQQLEARHAPACNDNGVFAPRLRAEPLDILKVAAELSGWTSVTYAADGVLMIASGREHGERTSASPLSRYA